MKKYILAVLVALVSMQQAFAAETAELATITVTADTNYQVHQKVDPVEFNSSVHVQETSPGMKSPYIGAFTGNQVDQTVNGIRMNNALFRSGPNQYYGGGEYVS